MSPLLALIPAWLAPVAHAADVAGSHEIDCVGSHVALTFSILDVQQSDETLFKGNAVLDTACTGALDEDQLHVVEVLLGDLCQVAGVEQPECLDVVTDAIGDVEPMGELVPLVGLGVEVIEQREDGLLADLTLRFDDDTLSMPASVDPTGGFETRVVSAPPDPAEDALLDCRGTGSVGARGHLSEDRTQGRVEIDRTHTFVCRTGLEDLFLELEVEARQRAGEHPTDLAVGSSPARSSVDVR